MLAQLVSVALTASVKATDTKSVSSFNHFLSQMVYNENAGAKLNDHLSTRLEVYILLLDQKSTIISLCTVLHSITAVFTEQVQQAIHLRLISDGKNDSGSTEI